MSNQIHDAVSSKAQIKGINQGVAMGMVPLTVISKHTQNFCILSRQECEGLI